MIEVVIMIDSKKKMILYFLFIKLKTFKEQSNA